MTSIFKKEDGGLKKRRRRSLEKKTSVFVKVVESRCKMSRSKAENSATSVGKKRRYFSADFRAQFSINILNNF